MGTTVSKFISWCMFLTGITAAVMGIAELHVEVTVFGLIIASTSGMILLKMRAEACGRLDGLDGLEHSPRAMIGASRM